LNFNLTNSNKNQKTKSKFQRKASLKKYVELKSILLLILLLYELKPNNLNFFKFEFKMYNFDDDRFDMMTKPPRVQFSISPTKI
jgi:hypothetical protein